jgi:hypothetical protein
MVKKRKPGRKPKPVDQRKSATINARVGADLRKELDKAAKAAKRSLSAEVAARLRRSFTQRPDVFGDDSTRALALTISRLASWVQTFTGRPWPSNRFTFEAMAAGVRHLMEHPAIVPSGSVEPDPITLWKMEGLAPDLTPQGIGLSAFLGVLHELTGPGSGNPPAGSIKLIKRTARDKAAQDRGEPWNAAPWMLDDGDKNAEQWNDDLRRMGELLIRRTKDKEPKS